MVVIEFPDGMHEYVTTPVKRVLRLAGREVFYIETINSRYRLEVRGREAARCSGSGVVSAPLRGAQMGSVG